MSHVIKESLSRKGALLLWLERLLLAVGLLSLGIVAFAVIDARWFAYQEGQRLDRALRARSAAPAAGRTAGTAAGGTAWTAAPGARPPASDTDRLDTFHPGGAGAPPAAPEGSVIGRIEIPRVGISSLLLEGIAGSTLRHGVGHIPGTSLPQLPGNVGLAGHRDTVFRGLKDIRKGDLITLETLEGSFRYAVDWAQVVDPDDVSVLTVSNRPQLTLVTCYPFYYVGSAPERFVVRAHLLAADGKDGGAAGAAPAPGAAAPAPGPAKGGTGRRR